MEQGQTFVFFGIVGSGKGTQVKLLMNALSKRDGRDTVYAYPGAEYRKLIEGEGYTGNIIKESLHQGQLQPDFLTNAIFTDILVRGLNDVKHLIADGYPRTVAQSEVFETMMRFWNRGSVKIIYIEVGKEEALKRNLLRGRADDTPEGLEKRFDEYVNNVIPAMEYFQGKEGYEVFHINGEQSVEAVHAEIITALGMQ